MPGNFNQTGCDCCNNTVACCGETHARQYRVVSWVATHYYWEDEEDCTTLFASVTYTLRAPVIMTAVEGSGLCDWVGPSVSQWDSTWGFREFGAVEIGGCAGVWRAAIGGADENIVYFGATPDGTYSGGITCDAENFFGFTSEHEIVVEEV